MFKFSWQSHRFTRFQNHTFNLTPSELRLRFPLHPPGPCACFPSLSPPLRSRWKVTRVSSGSGRAGSTVKLLKTVDGGTEVAPPLRAPQGALFQMHWGQSPLTRLAAGTGSAWEPGKGLCHETCREPGCAVSTGTGAQREPHRGSNGAKRRRPHCQRPFRGVPGFGAFQQRHSTRGAVQCAEAPILCDDVRGQKLPHLWREWLLSPASRESPSPAPNSVAIPLSSVTYQGLSPPHYIHVLI